MIQPGLEISHFFTSPDCHPFLGVEWDVRHARIMGENGKVVFEQEGVEFPHFWSDQAVNIVASKYFRVVKEIREHSVRQMIGRVSTTIAQWGVADGYFDKETAQIFWYELTHILLNQYASFNSPVWFNVGAQETPQCSACYILSVEDSMESILNWYHTEGVIFKGGSGAGVNLSAIRAEGASLSNGGKASGPLSFMRVADANAGAVKSGGSTRRAAKMVIMDIDHPDIEAFINCKVKAEKMGRALIAAGYQDGLEEEVRQTIPFQNANNSVNVSAEYMQRVLSTDHDAQNAFHDIAQATWECGDPGMFFGDTVNAWHTCPSSGRISSSNPCGEFLFLDDSACNLASINLLKFLEPNGSFNVYAFEHTVDILITAQDILVDRSSYPTEKIAQNSRDFRPLGLGYANLGALLMSKGLPYDSDEGRAYAGSVTALMTGEAYAQSGRLAQVKGAFAGYAMNKEAMNGVMDKHMTALRAAEQETDLWQHAHMALKYAMNTAGFEFGFRNSQVTLLAPTGTISFMMDCDTTGIEPDIGLVKYKKLVGGGTLKMVNNAVRRTLRTLGYTSTDVEGICGYIYDGGNLVTCPWLKPEHHAVFYCAFPSHSGGRVLYWPAHVKMVAAVQPFLSGGVSKTVNMPHDATVAEIKQAYILAWELGLKSVAIYRDGCKAVQPVTTQSPDHVGGELTCPSCHTKEALVLLHSERNVVVCRYCHCMPVYATQEFAARVLDCASKQPVKTQEDSVETFHGVCQTCGNSTLGQETAICTPPSFPTPTRKRLPDERPAVTHKFNIGGHEGYLTVGEYPDSGTPGELFIHMAKEGSTVSGLMDTVGILTSLLFQHGVSLEVLTEKLKAVRFEPSGYTKNPAIRLATSPVDYIFRWLERKYGTKEETQGETQEGALLPSMATDPATANPQDWSIVDGSTDVAVLRKNWEAHYRRAPSVSKGFTQAQSNGHNVALDAPTCSECGQLMSQRAGACFVCSSCGSSSGCS